MDPNATPPIEPGPPVVTPPEIQHSSFWKKLSITLGILLLLVLIGAGSMVILSKQKQNNSQKTQQISTPSITHMPADSPDGFFRSGVLGKSLANITIQDLPNTKLIRGVEEYKDVVWLSGDGALVEFNPSKNAITRYSDRSKANCDSNLVIINDYLYAPCRMVEINGIKNPDEYPKYGIYKINLKTYTIEKIFNNTDGLSNQENYVLHKDGDFVWVETFQGVGRINTVTNAIEFFTDQLGLGGTTFSIRQILPDKDYVWVVVGSNSGSTGGVVMYDKAAKTWTPYGPKEIIGDNARSIDLEWSNESHAIKLVPDGIQLATRKDGDSGPFQQYLLERQYSYTTKTWKTVGSSMPATGPEREKANKYLDQQYMPSVLYAKEDDKSYVQIFEPNKTEPKYGINGRANLWMSPVVNNKRYIVTGSSIDMLNSSLHLPKMVLQTLRDIDYAQPHTTNPEIGFYASPDSSVALVLDANYSPGFEGPDSWGRMHIWAFDMNTDTVIEELQSDTKYAWRKIAGVSDLFDSSNVEAALTFTVENKKLYLVKKNMKILEFDPVSKKFQILDTTLAK